ncbi:hypothetical protein J2S43_001889 [Catenuloplanes nepalensis]|uniref:Uncharacterized protein n=1 Tax=Catenuloplanes nepalensis TaxID=587533 RepID=A0ABT9MPP9_9ACTN|nr:hypothetical protein [Catenuloplanes nepalensis]
MFGAGEGPHAAGDFLPDFDHANFAFGRVVVERAVSRVSGKAQVVVDAVRHPAGQRGQFPADLGVLAGVVLDPDQGSVAERGDPGGQNLPG